MKLKGFFAGAAACAVIAGTVVGLAGPASADPSSTTTFAGAGSDTIQDVMNEIATQVSVGSNTFGSWDAFKPNSNPIVRHDPITPKPSGCANVSRPNGSGEGVTALRRSLSGTHINGTTTPDYPNTAATYPTGTGSSLPTLGSLCFDFARSSSGPGANAAPTNGLLQYIPFAQDAVGVAVGPTTVITNSFTSAELDTLYGTGGAVTKGTRRYVPLGGPNPGTPPAGVTDVSIHLLIPQSGSGTRTFFAGLVGVNATTLPAWVKDTYGPTNIAVEEHSGAPVAADANAVVPFSIAQYIAQTKGHNDRLDGAVLQQIDGQNAIASGKINPSFPAEYKREVYNVIPQADTVSTGPHSRLFRVFVGNNINDSINLCANQAGAIAEFGFNTITNCGEIRTNLRAFNSTQW